MNEAINLIENTSTLLILDVRTESEYLEGHINNSLLIPHDKIESRQDELPVNKSTPILVYCRSGSRSATASNTLTALNYTCVYNMLGGYTAWVEVVSVTTTTIISSTTITTAFTNISSTSTTITTLTSSNTSGFPFIILVTTILATIVYRRKENSRKKRIR